MAQPTEEQKAHGVSTPRRRGTMRGVAFSSRAAWREVANRHAKKQRRILKSMRYAVLAAVLLHGAGTMKRKRKLLNGAAAGFCTGNAV